MNNRPRGRQKNVTGSGSVNRRGEARRSSQRGSSGLPINGSPLTLIILIIALVFGGGSGLTSLFSGSSDTTFVNTSNQTGWTDTSTVNNLDTSVSSDARSKYTTIKGNNKDVVTLMVYMCGSDLESRSGMATSDLKEMTNATIGSNVNLLVYTGGTKKWKNNVVSSSVNQIYKVENGGLKKLESNMGNASMTNPSTLTSFIQYAKKNYSANRYQLILWDHGGGAIGGYGHDEKNKNDNMSLSEISTALKNGGITYDFIGFDACLMGTYENAIMLNKYADYLIASEETEPGTGWYYTDWLTKLSKNTSMSTLNIGKNIIDDFTSACAKLRGQKTTLSLIDLAELSATVPSKLKAFAKTITTKIKNSDYSSVSKARNATRSFAQGNQYDQVDLAHLATNIGNSEGKTLAESVKSAVKYNRTSSSITNAYGLSIYFPYESTRYVDTVVNTYNQIEMDSDYSQCIKNFASLQSSGQASYGGNQYSLSSIFESLSVSNGSSSTNYTSYLTDFLSGAYSQFSNFNRSNTNYLRSKDISDNEIKTYISDYSLDADQLTFKKDGKKYVLSLDEKQWDIVNQLDRSLYYDDGKGYIHLGYDNTFTFNDDGDLEADTDKTWLAINGQIVPYYHTSTLDDGENYTITGYVPCEINGIDSQIIIVFDNDNPNGYIAGSSTDYDEQVEGKNLTSLNVGDKIDFVCDYYSYKGEYKDSYYLGKQMTLTKNMTVSDVKINKGNVKVLYRFSDIYNQDHYTNAIEL